MSRLVVGISNVRNGNTLGTVLCTNPIGIGQIDTDCCRGIFIATQHSRTNGISSYPLNMWLTKTRINRRMVFKPLGILADGLRALRCLQVLILYNTFPRAFQTQRVTIYLNEPIHEVYPTLMFPNPFYAVVVEHAQVASLIIVDEQCYHTGLLLVFCHTFSLLKPIDDRTDGISITSLCRPHHLVNTGIVLDQRRI